MDTEYQTPSDSQSRYWHFMYDTCVYTYYLQRYVLHYQTIDRRIKYFLALMSSASIGTWAIWQKHAWAWSLLIVISQVISAIQHLLPFTQREKNIRELLPKFSQLFSKVECEYYQVYTGEFTGIQVHEKTIEFKGVMNDLMVKLDETVLPDNESFLAEAEEKAKTYLNKYYGG